ncbi:Thioredoxin reductase gliT [Colletotrichum sp. SAR11_59]|nr:Thioredoxin reductase gliT [Colletotrichum sp. SAR11_59]
MLHDVLIIGAGPSGLATATALSRQLYTSVVFDSGLYRNARAKNMHNVLGFDHVPPPVFRAKARADIQERYSATVTFADVAVTKTTKLANGLFRAEDAAGKAWFGRKLVLATGVTDITFEDGTETTEGFLAHAPYTKPNGPFVEQLGLEVAENGDIKTSQPFGETTVLGVYAVGDCGNMIKAVAPAATSGSMCAAGMVVPLQSEPKIELDVEDVEKVLG